MQQIPARAWDLGIAVGTGRVGTDNAITDITGVRVGHTSVVEGASVRTGVTAIVPVGLLAAGGSHPAAVVVGNGYGKFVGSTQIAELGIIETPVLLLRRSRRSG